ncbi:type VII secretion protein EssC [Enterococcus hirae]|uniref:type VII secretion protein EssC n=1 Tax=Enterococcus hirae TaxID=1354 RepID=UPI0039A561FA
MKKNNYTISTPMNDQIQTSSCTYFDIFYFDKQLIHRQITDKNLSVSVNQDTFSYEENKLLYNNEVFDQVEKYRIFFAGELETVTTNKPTKDFLISSAQNSAISLKTDAIVNISVDKETGTYTVIIYPGKDAIYYNCYLIEKGSYPFRVGDQLVINGLMIEVREKQLKLTSLGVEYSLNPWQIVQEPFVPEYPVDFPSFRRSPRIHLKEPKKKVEIVAPKAKPTESKNELLRTIVPPLGMVALSGATSILSGGNPIMMLSMGGASLLTAGFSVSSYLTNKREIKQKNAIRNEHYEQYLVKENADLKQLQQKQREALEYMNPSMNELALMTKEYHARIYERMTTNEDFLHVRLGMGRIPASFTTNYQSIEEDSLSQQAEEHLVSPYKFLEKAPIVIPMREQTIGLAGTSSVLCTAIQTLLFQISVLHSYRDVEFITLVPEEDYEKHWYSWRWLPHGMIRSLNLRGIIHNAQTRDIVLNSFYQMLVKRRQQVREAGNEKVQFQPHYILSILDESWLSGHGLNEFLAEDMSQYGVTVIWAKESLNMLPETATTIVEYQSNEAAILINQNNEYVNQLFVPNHLPTAYSLEQAIQRLANLDHVEVEKNVLPEAIDFLDLYNVKEIKDLNIKKRWQKNDTSKSLAVPLGVRGKDDIVYLNLHERAHGPHGLIAGTTGSGKSEIVQSYMLSLAVNFAPEDVGFLPIDFKGGGMANLFAKLPHLLGSITNLDGANSARALQSIRAELQKRQRKFSEFGVNHINGYTRLYKQGKGLTDLTEKKKYPSDPLPHLFLISDEFAELKANEPDFMAELVSTARIGRSLGVHLILATQKPSGVVDDQIWSNSRFKLALKVADSNDSNEIIKTPDAASITQPGRAYLQVGNNEIYELFQSAWSGADYDPFASKVEKVDERIWLINQLGQYELLTVDLPEEEVVSVNTEEKTTQLEAIVQEIANYAKESEIILPEKPWLPPLETLIVSPLQEKKWKENRQLSVPFGFIDIPNQQIQENFNFDLEDFNHTAIYGSPGFGKSTALQTLVMNFARLNTPNQVQFNLFDFGTNGLLPLKKLPHVADLVRLEEEEKLVKFLKRIRKEIKERKDAFTEYGVASLTQYEAKSGKRLPVIITIVDGFDAIKESPLEDPIESVLNQLLREGASVGLYTIITVLRTNSFKMSMTSNIPTHIGLYLVEENAIRDVVGRDALIPQEIIGRAQVKLEQPQEVQVYLPAEGENDIARLNRLEQEIEKMSQEWTGETPLPIPMLPKTITMANLYNNPQTQQMLENMEFPIAFDKETTNVVGFKPAEHGYFVIGDDTPQQNEAVEKVIIEDMKHFRGRAQRIVFNYSERFGGYADSFDTVIAGTEYGSFVNELLQEIEQRQMMSEYEPMLIYIPEAQLFVEKSFISAENLNIFLKKGSQVAMYFIFQTNQKSLENSFNDADKLLRANIPAGMVGTRLVEQSFVKTKTDYNEPAVELDEFHFFEGRTAMRVKLVSE